MNNQFIFREYINDTPSIIEPTANSLFTLVEQAIINYNIEIPKPETIISISQKGYSDVDLFTKGSISLIIGKAKSGKTALTSVLVRSIINGTVNGEYTSLHSTSDKKVLLFDTEQGNYFASRCLHNILHGCEDKQNRIIYYDLRPYEPKTRFEMMKTAIDQNKDDIDFILIDGVRDITYDINSSEEAITVVSELMSLSVKYNIHICTILHQNKGDANARGHLGTECVNKAEIVLTVQKEESKDCSIIDAEYCRGISFKPFAIKRNGHGVPYIDGVAISKSENKRKRTHDFNDIIDHIHINVLNEVFSKSQTYKYTQLYQTLKIIFDSKGYQIGENKAKSFITQYLLIEWINKDGQTYTINDSIKSETPF